MTPISGSLQTTTVVLAVLAALATWLLWNRVRGPRAVRVLQRTTLLVFGELMAAMAILVWVNISSGGLVVSWQDLLGNQSTRGGVFAGQLGRIALDPKAQAVAHPASFSTGTSGKAKFRPSGGGFQETTFRGPVSGITSQVYVWTPPQYAQEPHTYFPVLELLHGVPGSPGGWTGPMNVVQHLEAVEGSGSVFPYILVVPEVTPVYGHTLAWNNEECRDRKSVV